MVKKILFLCLFLCLLAAASGTQAVSAGVDPLASPTPRTTERITAPVISGVNPEVVLSEGNLEDSLPSGSFVPVEISFPVSIGPPLFVQLDPQSDTADISTLNISQNTNDINCGPAALAQALEILEPEDKNLPPTTNQLGNFMSTRGLLYDWGTGVEELAFTARKFGYEGSIPFQDWGFDKLAEILRLGRPVVVSLGSNGAEKPGHFITLTGMSGDGKWITYMDSISGEAIISREEFQSLWKLQGNAGMIPQKKTAMNLTDPMLPWMGLFGVISALALTLNQSTGWGESRAFSLLRKQLSNPRRKGIGGGPLPPKEPEVIRIPRYERKTVYRGIKTVEVEVPVYETRKVKVGIREINNKVPQYETRRVKVGVENVSKRVPIYTNKKIKTGTKLMKKEIPVTRYKTKTEMIWKKYSRRVPIYKTFGTKRFVIGYKNEVRWKRVPNTKKVPYRTTKTITVEVPVFTEKRIISGYQGVTEKVPKYEQKKILVGHKIIQDTVPIFEERRVQTGTKTVTREMPQYETVRVVTGYDEIPQHREKTLNEVEQKIKLICDDEKLKELVNGRDFEITDVVYLKGGPGAGYGIEKVENSWSGHSGGGGGSTLPMLAFKLLSRGLVWVRDGTKILEGPSRKPDAQAIIMYSENDSVHIVNDIVVINKGNEPIIVRYINVKNTRVEFPNDETYIQLFPYNNTNGSASTREPIAPGDFRVFKVDQSIGLSQDVDRTLLIQLSTPSNRSGFLIHDMEKVDE